MTRRARVARIASWMLVAGLATVVAIRVAPVPPSTLVIALQAGGMWILGLSYVLAVIALVQRRGAFAVASLVLVAAHVVWAASLLGWHGPRSDTPPGTPLTISSANMLLDNPNVAGFAARLASENADVVVIQEVTTPNLNAIKASALWADYPYRVAFPHPYYQGTLVLSHLPMTGTEFDVKGSPMVRVEVQTASGPLELIAVHTVAPLTQIQTGRWENQFRELAHLASIATEPTVFVGDFNATLDHAPMRAVLAAGMRDAFDEVGAGWGATFPQWSLPSVLRLDHLLASDGVEVLRLDTLENVGSDHRRIVVRVVVS
jgi:endonuclease/exonuclease/phosphatase (EEP) superfamily protein YafD